MPRLCTLSEPCADTATVLVTPGGERERERRGGVGREKQHTINLCVIKIFLPSASQLNNRTQIQVRVYVHTLT